LTTSQQCALAERRSALSWSALGKALPAGQRRWPFLSNQQWGGL